MYLSIRGNRLHQFILPRLGIIALLCGMLDELALFFFFLISRARGIL